MTHISDVTMPEMDGLKLLQEIQKSSTPDRGDHRDRFWGCGNSSFRHAERRFRFYLKPTIWDTFCRASRKRPSDVDAAGLAGGENHE